MRTGINRKLVLCIEDSIAHLNDFEKDAIILWDEMRIKQHIEYDKNLDNFLEYWITERNTGIFFLRKRRWCLW